MKPWRTRIPKGEQEECLRTAFYNDFPLIALLILEEGNIGEEVAKEYVWEAICCMQNAELLEALLGIVPRATERHLRTAVGIGNAELVEIVLKNGAKPSGKTIIKATKKGDALVLEELLEVGGNPDTRNGYPINLAIRNGWPEVVSILLKYGANLDNICAESVRQAQSCADTPGYPETLKILENAGYSIK